MMRSVLSTFRIHRPMGLLGVALLLCTSVAAQQGGTLPAAGGVQPSAPQFHVLRSVSGSKGTPQGGRFVMDDPRTVFYTHQDKQVIVYFEWEGPRGQHKFEGFWKDPNGKLVIISDFQYEATANQFAGYWTMLLSDGAPVGVWTLEAHIDGESAGSHTFEVTAARGAPVATPARHFPTASEIYSQTLKAMVFVQKLSANGEIAETHSGFFLEDGMLITAFEAIDGASRLRLILSNGQQIQNDQVVGWNRWQDWAVLHVEGGKLPHLEHAKGASWEVGDRCFFLDVASEGNRVIVDENITGKNDFPRAGPRLNVSFASARQAIGSPLLNEYGDVIGMVGGALIPGATSLDTLELSFTGIPSAGATSVIRGGLAVPIEAILQKLSTGETHTLAELWTLGQFITPLSAKQFVSYGVTSLGVDKKGEMPWPKERREQFSHRDGKASLFVLWDPKEKRKALSVLRLYDIDNKLISEAKPLKLDLRAGVQSMNTWDVPVTNLPAGTYRLDVLLDDGPAWRGFFRVIE
jgi:S1-C subfamily serine protease